jgi:hypothetical protein
LRTCAMDQTQLELLSRRYLTVLQYNKPEEHEKRWKLRR